MGGSRDHACSILVAFLSPLLLIPTVHISSLHAQSFLQTASEILTLQTHTHTILTVAFCSPSLISGFV